MKKIFKNNVFIAGEKVKKIRQYFGIKQNELARLINITNGYLSMLENSRYIPEEIANKIIKIFKDKEKESEKFIGLDLNLEWLNYSKKNQAVDIVKENICILEDTFDEKVFKKTLYIIKKYNLEMYFIKLTIIASESYFFDGDYKSSFKYAKIALDKNKNTKNYLCQIKIYINLIRNYILYNNTEQAINYSILCLDLLNKYDDKNLSDYNKIYYNFCIIYKNLNQHELSIAYLERIDKSILSNKMANEVKLQEALHYLEIKQFKVSIKKHKEIFKNNIENIDFKAKIYRNIAECYSNLNNINEAIRYIEMCLDIRINSKIKSSYLTENLRLASDIYVKKENYYRAIELLIQAIKIKNEDETKEKLINVYILNRAKASIIEGLLKDTKKLSNCTLKQLVDFYFDKNLEKAKYFLSIIH